jgi:hypothetical protein
MKFGKSPAMLCPAPININLSGLRLEQTLRDLFDH